MMEMCNTGKLPLPGRNVNVTTRSYATVGSTSPYARNFGRAEEIQGRTCMSMERTSDMYKCTQWVTEPFIIFLW